MRVSGVSINGSAIIEWTLTCLLLGFLYGYDIGATSFVLHTLSSGAAHGDVWWNDLGPLAQGLLVGAVSAGALAGSHIVLFHLASVIGRRMELRIASALYVAGTLLNIASGTIWAECESGWWALVVGRLIFGAGVGFVMHGAPTYMAEMAPTSIRGAIVSAKETVIVGGIVIGYAIGDALSSSHWTVLYGLSCLAALPMCLLTFIVPRSKRWLLMRGQREEAKRSMQFVYRGNVDAEFHRLATTIASNQFHKQPSTPAAAEGDSCRALLESRLFAPEIRPALTTALGVILFQQLSGQPSIISYATILFAAAGWSGHATVVTSVLMLIVSSVTVAMVDRVGRKRLLLACSTVMGTTLGLLALLFWNWHGEFGSFEKTLVLLAMFVYIGGYQLGFGPITWLLVSEVFPGDVRGPATALGVECNYLLNFLVQFLLPLLQAQWGWGPVFGVFSMAMVVGFWFIQQYVPETTGLSLEAIEAVLQREPDVETVVDELSPLVVTAARVEERRSTNMGV